MRLNRKDQVFISRINLWRNPQGAERLKTITKNIEYDVNQEGYWIRRGSTAHSLALLLGFEPYDIKEQLANGVYDRSGKIK